VSGLVIPELSQGPNLQGMSEFVFSVAFGVVRGVFKRVNIGDSFSGGAGIGENQAAIVATNYGPLAGSAMEQVATGHNRRVITAAA